MPITQEQMIEQMQEARANHAEMKAVRTLVLNYINHVKETYPGNGELQESMTALSYTIQMRPVPDDRATYMNERYYARFAKRNARAKERQTLIRKGIFESQPRRYKKRKTGDSSEFVGRGPAPIFPREHPDDAPLVFDSVPNLTIPESGSQEENLFTGLNISLDETSSSCNDDFKKEEPKE